MLNYQYPINIRSYNNYINDKNKFFYRNDIDPQFLHSEYKKMNFISKKNNFRYKSQQIKNSEKLNSYGEQLYNKKIHDITPNNNRSFSDISEITKNDSIFELVNNIELNRTKSSLNKISNNKNFYDELKEKIFELNNEINEKNKMINYLSKLVQMNEKKYGKVIAKKNDMIVEIEKKHQKYYKQIYILENRVKFLEKENHILKAKNTKLMLKIKNKSSKYHGSYFKKNKNFDIEKEITYNNKSEYLLDNLLSYNNNLSDRNHNIQTKPLSNEGIEQKNNDRINLIINNVYNNDKILNSKKPYYTQSNSIVLRGHSAKRTIDKNKIIDDNFRYIDDELKTQNDNFYSYNKLFNNINNY